MASVNTNTGGNRPDTPASKNSKATQQSHAAHADQGFHCIDSVFPSLATITIFFTCTILECIFICPWYMKSYPMKIWLPVIVVMSLTTLTTVVNFSYASYMNPGFLPKAPDRRYLKRQPSSINVNGVPLHLKHCRTCNYYRMPRTTHCGQCDYCVDNFDHHCPWVNNCIGRRNYRYFFAFLCCLTTHIIVSLSICLFYIWKQPGELFSTWNTDKVIAFTLLGCAGLVMIPVVGLLCFHIFLITKGLSTNEYVTKKYKGKSPFDMGPCQNCAFQLCSPEYPVFKPGDENDSQEVQREIVMKFTENGNRKESEEFPLRKVGKLDNLAEEDLLDTENNNLTPIVTNDFCSGGENLSYHDDADIKPTKSNEHSNETKREQCNCNDDMSDSQASDRNSDNHLRIVNGSGDISCLLPIEILQEQDLQKQIIIPSP